MRISDAFLLSKTKFKTRKVRSVLTVIGAAFVVAIVLFLSFSITGIKNSVKDNVSPFAEDNLLALSGSVSQSEDDTIDTTTKEYVKSRWQSIAKEVGLDPAIATEFGVIASIPTFTDIKLADSPALTASSNDFGFVPTHGLRVVDIIAIDKYVSGSVIVAHDEIGVLMPMFYLKELHRSELESLSDAQQMADKLKSLQEFYLGKSTELAVSVMDGSSSEPAQTTGLVTTERRIKVKIIGFYPETDGFISSFGSSGDYSAGYNFYTEMNEFKSKHSEDNFSKIAQPTTMIVKIKDKASQKQAKQQINDHYKDNFEVQADYYGDVGSNIAESGKSVKKIIFWIGIAMLIFVSVPMMGTMSKVLTDSTRESGVFRAIGARNSDMMYIYILYSMMLSTAAFICGFIIASSINLLLSAKYGSSLGAELVGFSGSSIIKSVSLYGVNIIHCLVIYGLLLAAGVVGSVLPIVRTLHKDPIMAMRDE